VSDLSAEREINGAAQEVPVGRVGEGRVGGRRERAGFGASSASGRVCTIKMPTTGPSAQELCREVPADSGALATQARPTDPGLASLIDARPHLPETIRRAVFALVRAAYH
jgi:hypothetical protein